MLKRVGVVLLLLLGIFLLVFHEPIIEFLNDVFGPKDPRPVVAKIETFSGEVDFKKPKTLSYRKVRAGTELRIQDTIVTGNDSTTIIAFNTGFRLEVDQNSIIIIEQPEAGESGELKITFLRGNFKVLDKGQAGSLILSKDNILQDPSGTVAKPLTIAAKPKLIAKPSPPPIPSPVIKSEVIEEIKTVAKPTPKPTPKAKETLPQDYIDQVIKKQTPFFNRCYSEHLRLNPNARGRISLSFTIMPNGSVENVRVLGSTLKDPKLERCTVSVIERIRFRKFDGDPSIYSYPLNFE